VKRLGAAAALLGVAACSRPVPTEAWLRAALARGSGHIRLPTGAIEISSEIAVRNAHDLTVEGDGGVLRAAPGFRGRALLSFKSATGVRLRNFSVDGNRAALETRQGLPPSDVPFARFTPNNGLLIERSSEVEISGVAFSEIAGFAILVNASRGVRIGWVRVTDSGSRNAAGRNNTTGGILLEEGTTDFEVRDSELARIRGNGVWTHSLYTSPRNGPGRIADNRFEEIGRDAVQVGHATRVVVEGNTGRRIGFPTSEVDIEGRAYPVGIDTAGNVDASVYRHNCFEDLNGKCIDLDGFHHGQVLANVCVNRRPPEEYPFGNYGIVMNNTNPDMQSEEITIADNEIDGPQFGGIFVIGAGHQVLRNRLRNVNRAHCNEDAARFGCYHAPGEPDMLRSGIYLGRGAERPAPARGNRIEDNQISGYEMDRRCIAAAPGVRLDDNIITRNRCEVTP